MITVDDVKLSLDSNFYLSDAIKANIYELIVIFNNHFPDVSLENLKNRLNDLKILKSNKFINRNVSNYDFRSNILYFNKLEMEKGYDMKHVLMFELLNIITSTKDHTGFNVDNKYEALNVGFTEIIANYLVGNNSDKFIYADEAVSTNLVSVIIGSDSLYQSYFTNNPQKIIEKIENMGGNNE